VHLSSSDGYFDLLSNTSANVSFETCPHYLSLPPPDGMVPDGAPQFKCCPPIRPSPENTSRLWEALKLAGRRRGEDEGGGGACVVTDHSPCTPSLKRLATGDVQGAWGGIGGLGLGLSVVWSEAVKRDVGVCEVARWMCENTADLARLGDRKGRLRVGYDADFVVWDESKEWTVSGEFYMPTRP
jgi:allantoinase